jgi:hypothetical protein
VKKVVKYFALCVVFFAGGIAITDDYYSMNNYESASTVVSDGKGMPENPPGEKKH